MARKTKSTISGSVLTLAILSTAGDATAFEHNVDVAELTKEIQQNLLMHGVKQKVQDACAGAETPESANARVEAVIKQLKEGTWIAPREGGGGSRTTKLAKALAEMYNISIEDAEAKLVDLDDDKVDALRKHPKVKATMAAITAREAAKKAEAAEASQEAGDDDALAAFA